MGLDIFKFVSICVVVVCCFAGYAGYMNHPVYEEAKYNAESQMHSQINNTMTNSEKHDIICDVCNETYSKNAYYWDKLIILPCTEYNEEANINRCRKRLMKYIEDK